MLAIALNATTGSLEHTIDLGTVKQPKPIHPMNGYASPTSVIVGDRVIVDFGQYGTWGLDKNTGKQLWHRTIVVDDSVGPGSSPIAHGGLVILTRDGMDKQFVEAVSVADGKTAWKTDRPPLETSNPEFRKSYSTPLLMKVGGTTQAIIPGSQWCVSYDAISGEELWRFEHGSGFSVTPMPSRIGDNIVFSTGFMRAELIAIDPTGRGDVTESHVAWRIGKGGSRMSSMVQDGDRLYSISDDGILTVLRNDDGGTVYRKRLGGKFSASPFRVGNRIWIANHDGEVTVFEAGDEFRTVADYTFDEQIMASPVVNGNDLLIRTAEAVYCFGGK